MLDAPDLKLLYDGEVYAVAYLPDGSLIVGGNFSLINGQRRRNLARVFANGEVDPDWKPQPDRSVTALSVDAAGNVYVGGRFFMIGGQAHSFMAKIRAGSAGQVDPQWPVTLGIEPNSKRILVSADGTAIFVATPRLVQKISSDGVLASEWGLQLRGDVNDIALAACRTLPVEARIRLCEGRFSTICRPIVVLWVKKRRKYEPHRRIRSPAE